MNAADKLAHPWPLDGWKPITMKDPGFYWRDLDIVKKWVSESRLFVQGGARQGIGKIS